MNFELNLLTHETLFFWDCRNPNGDSKADGKEEASQFGWKEKAGHKLEGNVQDVDEASSNRLGMSALGPEPVIPNWPLYDSMDKKYLLLGNYNYFCLFPWKPNFETRNS